MCLCIFSRLLCYCSEALQESVLFICMIEKEPHSLLWDIMIFTTLVPKSILSVRHLSQFIIEFTLFPLTHLSCRTNAINTFYIGLSNMEERIEVSNRTHLGIVFLQELLYTCNPFHQYFLIGNSVLLNIKLSICGRFVSFSIFSVSSHI